MSGNVISHNQTRQHEIRVTVAKTVGIQNDYIHRLHPYTMKLSGVSDIVPLPFYIPAQWEAFFMVSNDKTVCK